MASSPLNDLRFLSCTGCRNIIRPDHKSCSVCGTERYLHADDRPENTSNLATNDSEMLHFGIREAKHRRKKTQKMASNTQVFRPNKGYVSKAYFK